jgi:hypothetical protein
MFESKFKTLRHIETVRNYINHVVTSLLARGAHHDQSKLQPPEVEIFDEYTPFLRSTSIGSKEYDDNKKAMKVALDHHYEYNRHHPEYFQKYVCTGCFKEYQRGRPASCTICGTTEFNVCDDITQMNLIDLIEMMCDWQASTLRHNDGNIFDSIEINQERFRYSDELKCILIQTAHYLQMLDVHTFAKES